MTMPAMACAALASTSRETTFSPATSTTDGIRVMSQQPTYGATLPLADVYRDREQGYDICDVRGKMCF